MRDGGVARSAAVREEVAGLLDGGEPPVLRDLVDNADKSIVPSSLFSTDPAVRRPLAAQGAGGPAAKGR